MVRSISKWRSGSRVRRRTRALAALIGAGAIATLGATAAAATAAQGSLRVAHPRVNSRGVAVHITKVGTVNFRTLAQTAARQHATRALGPPREMPLMLPSFVKRSSTRAARAAARVPNVTRATGFAGNVRGEKGFNGMDHTANEIN